MVKYMLELISHWKYLHTKYTIILGKKFNKCFKQCLKHTYKCDVCKQHSPEFY